MSAGKSASSPSFAGLDNAPLLRSERTWRGGTLLASSTSTAVATWCFVLGGTVAYYLDAVTGTIAMMAGILIGIGVILISIVPVATKYGVDSALSSKTFMGSRGWYLAVALLFVILAGWNTVIVVILGRAVAEILVTMGLIGEQARSATEVVAMLAGLGVVWLVIRRGSSALASSSKWIAMGVLVLAMSVLGLLVKEVGVSGLLDAAPLAPFDNKATNVTISVEASSPRRSHGGPTWAAWFAWCRVLGRRCGRASSVWPCRLRRCRSSVFSQVWWYLVPGATRRPS